MSPTVDELRDLLLLASLRFDLLRDRESAGVIEAVSWLVGTSRGPGTGRSERPDSRELVLAELCAAECLAVEGTGEPAPPLRAVCAQLGVHYRPALTGDPEFGIGAWRTLRWALGLAPAAPMRIPLRDGNGRVLDQEQILGSLDRSGMAEPEARAAACEMAADSRRLAELVRLRAAVVPAG